MRGFRFQVGLAVTAVGTIGLVMLSGQQTPGGPFTAAQAAAGRMAYQANCASCHLADLKGSGDAAQLAGSEFMDAWGRRTTRELLSFMQLTMPPTRPGALSQEEYAQHRGVRPPVERRAPRQHRAHAASRRRDQRGAERRGPGRGGRRRRAGTRRAARGRASRRGTRARRRGRPRASRSPAK